MQINKYVLSIELNLTNGPFEFISGRFLGVKFYSNYRIIKRANKLLLTL